MMKQNHEPSHVWFKLVAATRRLGFLRTSVNAGDNYAARISTCPHKSLMQIPVWSESTTTCKNILVIICYCCHESKIKENLLLSYVLSKTIAKPAQQNKPLLSTSFRLKTSFKKKSSGLMLWRLMTLDLRYLECKRNQIFTRAKSTSAFYFDEYLLMNNILIFLSGLLKTNQVIPEYPTDDHRDSPLFFF